MKHTLLLPVIAVGLALLAVGCGGGTAEESESGPAIVSGVEGTDLFRIELTAKAAERLAIRTAAVERDGGRIVVPYSAVLYSPTGETWVYVSPKPLTFVRHRIVVDRIDGKRAVLKTGPPRGVTVATVGVAELFGAESGLGQ
jgi:hypothetical protein